jgi:hypothetical protein
MPLTFQVASLMAGVRGLPFGRRNGHQRRLRRDVCRTIASA